MSATPLSADLHPLLTEYVIKLLGKHRVTTVYSFVRIDSGHIAKIVNLPPIAIVTIKAHLTNLFVGPIPTAASFAERPPIATGITELDALLKGGLRPGHVYELCGDSCTGKTQLCHTLAANVAFEKSNRPVYFVDTKCAFSAIKIQQILERRHKDLPERRLAQALENIKLERVFNPELLVQAIERLAKGQRAQDNPAPNLLIINSLPSLWYLLHGAKSSFQWFGLLTKLILALRQFASQHSVAVVLVNLAVRAPEKASERKKRKVHSSGSCAALGRYWESAPGTRLLMLPGKKKATETGERIVEVWKSTHLRTGTRKVLRITDAGVI